MKNFLLAFLFLSFVACGQTAKQGSENTNSQPAKQSTESNNSQAAKQNTDTQAAVQNTESNNSQVPSEWKVFDQPEYSISYPPTWTLNQNGQGGSTFFVSSPLESDKDIFMENVSLTIQDIEKNMNLGNFADILEKQLKTTTDNLVVAESKKIKNDKGEYHKLVYSGNYRTYHLAYEQYCWVVNGKAYILKFTAEQDKLDKYKDAGVKVLNSFVLKK